MTLQESFKAALKINKRVMTETGDAYYLAQDQLNATLRSMLHMDLTGLTKKQLIQLVAWCSSHRPYAPHVVLSYIADNVEREFKL